LFFVLITVAAPVWAEQPNLAVQAQALHEQGVEAFQQEHFREAIQAFEGSERMAHNTNNLWNIMRCYEELGELDAALRSLDRYLESPDLTTEEHTTAEEHRRELAEAQRSAAPPQPETSPVPPPPVPTPAEPMPRVEQPGPESTPTEVPQTGPEQIGQEAPSLAGPWAVLGTGLALLLIGGILDIVAFARSDPEGQDEFSNLDEVRNWREGAHNLALAGDVLVGVGAAAAVGGLIWLLVARNRRASNQATGSLLSLAAGRDGLLLQARLAF
jgi:tetratricopeptide (TPR) repeat protein